MDQRRIPRENSLFLRPYILVSVPAVAVTCWFAAALFGARGLSAEVGRALLPVPGVQAGGMPAQTGPQDGGAQEHVLLVKCA